MLKLRLADFFAFQIFLHDGLVLIGSGLNHLLAILLGQIAHAFRDFFLADILAFVVVIDLCLHGYKVNQADKVRFRTDRKLDRHRIGAQALMHHLYNIVKIRARNVHLIDIRKAGHAIFSGLPPNRFGLRFNAALRTKNGNSAIQHAEGAFYLHGKVHVTRRVNDVDPVAFPISRCRRGGDSDAALLLLHHEIHGRSAFVRFTKLMDLTGIKQDALGRRRLSRVYMRHDADVSRHLKRCVSCHVFSSFPVGSIPFYCICFLSGHTCTAFAALPNGQKSNPAANAGFDANPFWAYQR